MHPFNQTTVAVYQRHQASTAHIVIAWIFAVLTVFYMLPWAIAATRSKRNIAPIVLINIFLGWSLIGWIAAMIMACLNDPQPRLVAAVTTGAYGYPPAAPCPYPPQQPQDQQYPPQQYPQPGYPPQGYPSAQQYPPRSLPGEPPYPQHGYLPPRPASQLFQQTPHYQGPPPPQYQGPPVTQPSPTTPAEPPTYGYPDDDETTQLPQQP